MRLGGEGKCFAMEFRGLWESIIRLFLRAVLKSKYNLEINTMEKESENNLVSEDLLEQIHSLQTMSEQSSDIAAAHLYRLMFRHERNLNVLDQWADQVLDGCLWSASAEEDYRNYIKYIKAHDEKLAAEYQRMLDEMIKEEVDDSVGE